MDHKTAAINQHPALSPDMLQAATGFDTMFTEKMNEMLDHTPQMGAASHGAYDEVACPAAHFSDIEDYGVASHVLVQQPGNRYHLLLIICSSDDQSPFPK
jgi:hypothetical protein